MDPATARGFAILPSRGRFLTHLPAFFKAAADSAMTIPGYVVVNDAEYAAHVEEYDALSIPANWSILPVPGDTAAAKTEQALRQLLGDDMDYVFWLADDLRPVTPGWDVRVIEQLNGWNFVTTDDLLHAPAKANGAMAWSADLIRAVGYLFIPGLVHMYTDDCWEILGRATGCWTIDMTTVVQHLHVTKTGAKDETSRQTNANWEIDDRAFLEWRKDEQGAATQRILDLMRDKGVEMLRPDLRGVEVMLAVPCGDGRYERLFMESLRLTEQAVIQYGGKFRLSECAYVSDIVIARTRLFGAFLRSTATHMFFVDSDQAWAVQDFVKFLMADRDFIAAAGVRKVHPPSFAVNVSDDFGKPTPMHVDAERGYMEVTGVGMAFVCITRACAERMVEAYADLTFNAAEGREETALFLPMIFNKRYMSEDFAFVHRWRAIGGKAWVDPTVDLRHVGSYVWSGAWLSQLSELMAQNAA